jgi:uncharacterized protein (TIGR02246 family)
MRLLLTLAGLLILALPSSAEDKVDPKIEQQIHGFASKFDQTFNTLDPVAVAALYAEDGIHITSNGTFHGRQAIEKDYAKHTFQIYHANDHFTTVDRIIAVGGEVHAFGKWSIAFKDDAFTKHIEGHYLWVLISEDGSWKIRKDDSHEVSRSW